MADAEKADTDVEHYVDEGAPEKKSSFELELSSLQLTSFGIVTSAVVALFLNWQAQSGDGWLVDFGTQYPNFDELGHGIFELRGASNGTLDYSWRLSCINTVGITLAWLAYFFHQLGSFYVIYVTKRDHKESKQEEENANRWNYKLDKYNFAMMGVNAVGILLHFLVRKFFYDGLAAQMPESISQASVILILVIVVMLEQPRRGLLFGRYGKSIVCIPKEMYESLLYAIRKYHGYAISFGIIFTYHYHSYESTSAHLFGYFYTLLLMFQSNLIFHRTHKNRGWTGLLESGVLLHALGVALFQSASAAAQFGLGFFFIVVFVIFPGLPFIQSLIYRENPRTLCIGRFDIPALFALVLCGVFATSVTVVFLTVDGVGTPVTAFFIPLGYVISYLLIFVFFLIGYGIYQCAPYKNRVIVAYSSVAYIFVLLGTALLNGGGAPTLDKLAVPGVGLRWTNRSFAEASSICE